MPTTTTGRGRLTDEQVAQYQRDGYVLFKQPVLNPDAFARLQAIFEEDLARYGEDDLDTIHFRDPRLLEFLLSDEVLDLVQPVVGPNIGLWSSHYISKAARTGKATPWHEDSAYWQGRVSTMAGICTVWLALDEARIIHGARANASDRRRAGYTMRYFPTTSTINPDHPLNRNHPLWLARGVDLGGNRYANV